MLKRFWFGDLQKEDRERINTRGIGTNGLKLPNDISDKDVSYACPTNKERNTISAAHFKQHVLATHPDVSDVHHPPEHQL